VLPDGHSYHAGPLRITAEQFDSIVKPINMIGDGLASA
jgi:hypothetical protein